MLKYLVTTLTSHTGPIGKVFDENLEKLDVSPVSDATAVAREMTLEEFAAHLGGLGPVHALSTGAPKGWLDTDEGAVTKIGTRAVAGLGFTTSEVTGVPLCARTAANFEYPDVPGFLVFDHDQAHMGDGGALSSLEEIIDIIGKSLDINLWDYDFVARPSSSSYIYDADGNEVRGQVGAHIFVGLESMAQMGDHGPKRKLLDIAATNGYGVMLVGKAGQWLHRGPFDSALHYSGEKLVFTGDADFAGGYHSRRSEHQVINNTGRQLDLLQLLGDWNGDAAMGAWATLKAPLATAQLEARTEFNEELNRTLHINTDTASRALAARRELSGEFLLYPDHGDPILVRDIMLDPRSYLEGGAWCYRDPIEPTYGPGKAQVTSTNGRVIIRSMAHGGDEDGRAMVYETYFSEADIRELVKLPDFRDRWDDLSKLCRYCDPAVVAHIIHGAHPGLTVTATRNELRNNVEQQGRSERALQIESWRERYIYVAAGSGRFVDIRGIARGENPVQISIQSMNLMLRSEIRSVFLQPAEVLIQEGLVQSYNGITYVPPKNLGDPIPAIVGYYNGWRPGPSFGEYSGDPLPWLKLVHHLVPDPEVRELFLDWLAWQVQHPGIKTNWQVMMFSEIQGTGKDTMLEPIRWGLGRGCVDLTTAELASDFNSFLQGGPTLLVMQELLANKNGVISNKLKPLCAAPPTTLGMNLKNLPQSPVANTFGVIALTNHRYSMPMEAGDRRWLVIENPTERLPREFFQHLYHEFYAQGGKRQVMAWLAARDLANFDPNVLSVETDMKTDMQHMSHGNVYLMVEEALEKIPCRPYSGSEIKELIRAHHRNSGTVMRDKEIYEALRSQKWVRKRAQITNRSRDLWVPADDRFNMKTAAELFDLHEKFQSKIHLIEE
jgi:hypothetical protein